MHLNRWLTSVVLLPIVVLLILKGGIPFLLLIGVVCVVSLWEYFHIADLNTSDNRAMAFVGMILGFMIIFVADSGSAAHVLWILSFNLLICGIISVVLSKPDSPLIGSVNRQAQGMIYIPLLLSLLVLLRNQENGATWILLILCVIIAGDTGAYYAGTYLGKHKLIPRVSPGKTVEGAIGGLVANVAVGGLISYCLPLLPWGLHMKSLPWGMAALFFISIGAAGQLGDLYESQLKRAAGIKDSGKILPGHGGILDRIDALLFAAPVAYFFRLVVF